MSRRRIAPVLGAAFVLAAAPAAAEATSSPAPLACSPDAGLVAFSDALSKTTFDGTDVGGLSAVALTWGDKARALVDNRTTTPARIYDLTLRGRAARSSRTSAASRSCTRPDGAAYTGQTSTARDWYAEGRRPCWRVGDRARDPVGFSRTGAQRPRSPSRTASASHPPGRRRGTSASRRSAEPRRQGPLRRHGGPARRRRPRRRRPRAAAASCTTTAGRRRVRASQASTRYRPIRSSASRRSWSPATASCSCSSAASPPASATPCACTSVPGRRGGRVRRRVAARTTRVSSSAQATARRPRRLPAGRRHEARRRSRTRCSTTSRAWRSAAGARTASERCYLISDDNRRRAGHPRVRAGGDPAARAGAAWRGRSARPRATSRVRCPGQVAPTPVNGVTPPFPGQPIPGISAVIPAVHGDRGTFCWPCRTTGSAPRTTRRTSCCATYKFEPRYRQEGRQRRDAVEASSASATRTAGCLCRSSTRTPPSGC